MRAGLADLQCSRKVPSNIDIAVSWGLHSFPVGSILQRGNNNMEPRTKFSRSWRRLSFR